MRVACAGILIGSLLGGVVTGPRALAQPAPATDLERAKGLYRAAEAAVAEGRFTDAARDYGAAYDVTRDPVLFWKLGSANERAGRCDVALIYYGRYLEEARPAEAFAARARERVLACGGDARNRSRGTAPVTDQPVTAPPVTTPPVAAPPVTAPPVTAPPAAPPAVVAPAPVAATRLRPRHATAWLLVGTSIAFVTLGAVLAYSSDAAENDIKDLYVGLAGQPPAFDERTRALYDDLVAEGERYERLSWLAVGLAGATAVTAGVLFWRGRGEPAARLGTPTLTPTVSPDGAGVRAAFRF